jgi:class 3 adenylate cyclase
MGTGRRLVAVLAADVVGYSRLMGEDESGTAKSVREHREALRIIRGLGGRLVKTMGDGVLLEFSSVIAAVECVRCEISAAASSRRSRWQNGSSPTPGCCCCTIRPAESMSAPSPVDHHLVTHVHQFRNLGRPSLPG